jgi:hypothetical protein
VKNLKLKKNFLGTLSTAPHGVLKHMNLKFTVEAVKESIFSISNATYSFPIVPSDLT